MDAHALWRGPVLADLTDVAPIAAAVEGCARLYREVTDALIACAERDTEAEAAAVAAAEAAEAAAAAVDLGSRTVPELPEVEVVRRGLAREVAGRDVTSVAVTGARTVRRHPPEDLVDRLRGARWARRGGSASSCSCPSTTGPTRWSSTCGCRDSCC